MDDGKDAQNFVFVLGHIVSFRDRNVADDNGSLAVVPEETCLQGGICYNKTCYNILQIRDLQHNYKFNHFCETRSREFGARSFSRRSPLAVYQVIVRAVQYVAWNCDARLLISEQADAVKKQWRRECSEYVQQHGAWRARESRRQIRNRNINTLHSSK